MMFMTAKVDKKKIAIIAAAAAAVILLLVILFSGGEDAAPTASTVSNNDARVAFLKGFGWEVSNSPVESGQVRVPEAMSDVYERYNATLLVYKNQIIGGDVTNSAPKGTVSGFSMPKAPDNTVPSTTAPAPVE